MIDTGLKFFGRRRVLCVQSGLRGPEMGAGLGTLPLPATAREIQAKFDGERWTQWKEQQTLKAMQQ